MAAYANKRRSAEQKAANDARQEEIRRRVAAQKNKAQYDRWRSDEAEVKKTYPGFELARELSENPDFKTALEAGVPMMTAYRGAHFDELMAGVAGSAAQGAAINAARSIAANRQRPSETGLQGTAGAVQGKPDYASMSNSDFRALLKKMGY